MWSDFAPMSVGIALFAMIGFIVWTVVNGRRRQEHMKIVTEFNSRLLDRLGSVSDFAQFLQTEGGARFLDTLSAERGAVGPRDRIMRATHVGVILTVLGGGLILVGWGATPKDEGAFTVLGVIVLSLGIGFLLSSAASYRLARMLGVLDEDAAPRSPRR